MILFEFETNEVNAVGYYYPERQFGERAYTQPPYELHVTDVATGKVDVRIANNTSVIVDFLERVKAYVLGVEEEKRMAYQGYTRSNPFGRWEKTRKAAWEK